MNSPSIEALLDALSARELELIAHDWPLFARPEQLPPAGDWTTWLLIGGRGSGKTRAGAEWVRRLAAKGIGPIALVGETIAEALAVMVEGESGLMRVAPPDERPRLRGQKLLFPSGVEARLFGATRPEHLRGPQFAAAWCDELGKWPKAEATWDMLQFGLRLGQRPRQLVTTTPRDTALLRRLLNEPGTVKAVMPTSANRSNLAASFFKAVVARYEGTLLGRQELDGEFLTERPGALFQRRDFRVAEAPPDLERIVVALDPPVTGHERSDRCGLVVAGRAGDAAHVLADLSFGPARPDDWARRAVAAFHDHAADCLVAEVNQGGDLVGRILADIDPDLPIRMVRATRGKWVRAEPVAALYAQGRVTHAPGLAALEDELCALGPDGRADGHSPDRVDALVWALTELMLTASRPRVRTL
jgi:phage terminase large subunit-like protein